MLTENKVKKGNIYYAGEFDNFPEELEYCIQREIENWSFIRLPRLEDIRTLESSTDHARRLILIDDEFAAENKEAISHLRDRFPNANLCMLINDEVGFPAIIRDYLREGLIKSVLPMNLRVDLWLGAVRLMLNGGHYLPADTIKYMTADETAPEVLHRARAPEQSPRVKLLTKREKEVLRLLSEGHQNKIIAETLSLSEHTIKLHIHHIISKLSVSNRTEAAAIYLQEAKSPASEAWR